MEGILNILIWAAIIQGLFLSLLYIFSKKHASLANKLLGFFLLAFVFEALTFVSGNYIGSYSTNGYFTLPEVKMFFPVLFLHYVLEKIGRSEKYWPFLKINYFLAFAILGITLYNVLLYAFTGENIHWLFDFGTIESVFMIMQYYAFFLTIISIVIAIRETRKYTMLVKNTYSDLDMLQVRWLWQFIFAVVPIVIVWGMELIRIAIGGRGPSDFVSITWFLIVVFIYFLSYKAYQQKNLLEDIDSSTQEQNRKIPNQDRPPKDYGELSSQLTETMKSDKLYIDQDLTIYDLSKAINVSPRLISGCINQNFKVNFVEWINNFRVDEAMTKLNDSRFSHLSVEGIGMDSGFKSRSAMYTAFKKRTGHSPGHYRHS